MSPRGVFAFKLAISAGLLVWLLTGVDRQALGAALAGADPLLLAASVLLWFATHLVGAWRLQRLLSHSVHRGLGVLRLYAINLKSVFYGLAFPSDVGIAVSRWMMITRGRGGRVQVVTATVYERLLSVVTLAVFMLVALAWSDAPIGDERRVLLAAVGLGALGAAGGFLLLAGSERFARLARPLLTGLARRLVSGDRVEAVVESLRRPTDRAGLFAALLVSVVFVALSMTQLLVLYAALGGRALSPVDMFWIAPAVSLLVMLPVSVAGLGLREGGFAVLFAAAGENPALGVALGLGMFAHQLVVFAVGGALVWLSRETPTDTGASSGER